MVLKVFYFLYIDKYVYLKFVNSDNELLMFIIKIDWNILYVFVML